MSRTCHSPNENDDKCARAIVLCVIVILLFAIFVCSVKTRDKRTHETMNHLGERVGGHRVDER